MDDSEIVTVEQQIKEAQEALQMHKINTVHRRHIKSIYEEDENKRKQQTQQRALEARIQESYELEQKQKKAKEDLNNVITQLKQVIENIKSVQDMIKTNCENLLSYEKNKQLRYIKHAQIIDTIILTTSESSNKDTFINEIKQILSFINDEQNVLKQNWIILQELNKEKKTLYQKYSNIILVINIPPFPPLPQPQPQKNENNNIPTVNVDLEEIQNSQKQIKNILTSIESEKQIIKTHTENLKKLENDKQLLYKQYLSFFKNNNYSIEEEIVEESRIEKCIRFAKHFNNSILL